MSLVYSILGSGSSGNATFVDGGGVRLLIDCGLSLREMGRRMGSIGRSLDEIQLVLLTHEHDDHARGVEALLRARRVAVAGTRGTLRALRPGLAPGSERIELRPGRPARFGALEVTAFRVPHDAAEPVGFRVDAGPAAFGLLTDLGSVDGTVRDAVAGLTTLVAEANHDVAMLRSGPYPERLKRRILGRHGHLSNDALADLVRSGEFGRLETLVLAHLSRTNNRPDLALATVSPAVASRGLATELRVSPPFQATALAAASTGRSIPAPRPRLLAAGAAQMSFPFEEVSL